MASKYKVLARIWHTGDKCYYEAGESATMTHLADFQIERLIAQGVIEPLPALSASTHSQAQAGIAKTKREAKQHGDIDSTGH